MFGAALEFSQHGDQVIELTVDIANDDDFAIDAQKIGLGSERLLDPAENLLYAFLADLATLEEVVFDKFNVDLVILEASLQGKRYNRRWLNSCHLSVIHGVRQTLAFQHLIWTARFDHLAQNLLNLI